MVGADETMELWRWQNIFVLVTRPLPEASVTRFNEMEPLSKKLSLRQPFLVLLVIGRILKSFSKIFDAIRQILNLENSQILIKNQAIWSNCNWRRKKIKTMKIFH